MLYPARISLRITAALFLVLAGASPALTQGRFPPPPSGPEPGRSAAPIDLTGTWVSIVSEDWIHRMLTPRRGDYTSIPLNEEGKKVADAWSLDRDNAAGLQCKAFGAAALMRTPTRLQISWQDDRTLKIDADNGSQSRLLHFASGPRLSLLSLALEAPDGESTWQGYSVAEWETLTARGSYFGIQNQKVPAKGSLKVLTTRMKAGYLRANGVPYSEKAVLTETFDAFTAPNGDAWFVVTTVVDDPVYLSQPYITTSHFRRERDNSKWQPTACQTPPPTK